MRKILSFALFFTRKEKEMRKLGKKELIMRLSKRKSTPQKLDKAVGKDIIIDDPDLCSNILKEKPLDSIYHQKDSGGKG